MTQLFVYGSLLRGEERDGLVAHLKPREATIRGCLWRTTAGYPALELVPGGSAVKGEVLSLEKPSLLTILDMIEGTGAGLFSRVQENIQTQYGPEQAWVYVMNAAQIRRVGGMRMKGNDWRSFTRRR
jgi:gamma-glutamylcyclotransferase (GGCT)/AIG2-like uncharacterized protein YtfP